MGMGFWEEEEMLETQVKIPKKCGHFDSWFERAGLEEDTGEEPAKATEKV